MSRRFAQVVAGLGALTAGYMRGNRIREESERDAERAEREREEYQLKKDERQAAASTLAQAGTQTGEAVSGEDALTAGNQALTEAMARAGTPEEKAAIQQQYAPTIDALTAQRGTAATPGTTYTPEQAQGDFVRKMYSIDPAKAQQAEATQMQLEKGRDEARKTQALKAADLATADFMKKRITGEDGSTRLETDDDRHAASRFRTAQLAGAGQFGLAQEEGAKSFQYRKMQLDANKAERQADTEKALSEFDSGNWKASFGPYNTYVNDRGDAVDAKETKDGKLAITVVDRVTGEKRTLTDSKKAWRAKIAGIADSGAVLAHEQREFDNDLKTRHANTESGRLGLAQKADSRAQQSHDLGLPTAQVAATLSTLRQAYAGEEDPAKKETILGKINALQATGGSAGKRAESVNKLLDDVRAIAASNMKGGLMAGVDAELNKKLDAVTAASGAIIAEIESAGKALPNQNDLYTEAVVRATDMLTRGKAIKGAPGAKPGGVKPVSGGKDMSGLWK